MRERASMFTFVGHTASATGRACLVLATLSMCTAFTTSAHAETSATITPLLSPNRLGATGAVSLTIQFSDPGAGVPTPVRSSTLRFPVGLTLEVPHLRSCSAARLLAHGASACNPESLLGHGHALVEAQVGSQILTENVSLTAFLGPLRNIQPSVLILGQGYTPFDERVVIVATTQSTGGPYGEALTLAIPPIPTLALEPDASIATLSLAIGVRARRGAGDANTIRVPPSCPTGGFPFGGEFTYADGSTTESTATVRCP
jgi:hypothetical protein